MRENGWFKIGKKKKAVDLKLVKLLKQFSKTKTKMLKINSNTIN